MILARKRVSSLTKYFIRFSQNFSHNGPYKSKFCFVSLHKICPSRDFSNRITFSKCKALHQGLDYELSVIRFKHQSASDSKTSISSELYVDECSKRIYNHPDMGHNVLLIQPRVKFGPKHESKAEAELKIEEAATLVNTLPNWKVLEKTIISTSSLHSSRIFGKGNMEMLKAKLHSNPNVTAIFFGIDILSALQNSELEKFFEVPVFDRYQVILQIFHDHAKTKEAKLQLALAEIPYLRVKLHGHSLSGYASHFSGIQHVGGDGETYMEMRKRLLNEREIKLKKELEKIKNQRELLRRSDARNSLPIVAVVGYTNCGKTTLIKALTNDGRLLPEDKLFATLDVTLHMGMLPSNQKAFFIDTVGFISDVPTALIQSFRSTLEEINLADLVIHIRDISHPNTEAQKETVLATLQELNLPSKLLDSIVEVKNKVDLLEMPEKTEESDSICISATKGTGLPELLERVEEKLFENTGHSVFLMRIPNGGPEYSWIMKEAAIRDAIVDPKDENYLILEIVISATNLSIFKHMYGDLTVTLESISK